MADNTATSSIIMDGKKTSLDIESEIAGEVDEYVTKGLRPPHLAAILVGEDGASKTYVKNKFRACKRVGFRDTLLKFDNDISQDDLIKQIELMNDDPEIDGYIVQLPLPSHISVQEITDHIKPRKDVDGFTPANYGKMGLPVPGLLPATPKGIIELLHRYKVKTLGKHCVIVGNSHIVGSPMSVLMSGPEKATVTICHIYTKDLAEHTKKADILIVAVGKPGLITGDMVKEGVVVIDVGITRVEDKKAKRGYVLKGDVEFETVSSKASLITPVPGGVGPMTIASLLLNTLQAYKKNHDLS